MFTQQALWLPGIGQDFVVGPREIDTPGPGELLIRIASAALNPLDWKAQEQAFTFIDNSVPVVLGQEGAGIVEAVGEGVTEFRNGDRVFFQGDLSQGARSAVFQHYCIAAADLVPKIPENISFDQAASVHVAVDPFVISLYAQQPQGLGFLPPWEEGGKGKYAGQPILIMGGTSSLGQYAIQFARLSGFFPIITTASLRNTELLSSLGATYVLDRGHSTAALKDAIAKITSTPITLAFDAISLPDTQRTSYDILSAGGTLTVVTEPAVENKSDGKVVRGVFGSFHPSPNREMGKKFMPVLTRWLADGTLKLNTIEVVSGGLNGIPIGLQKLKDGLVSGRKLVVHPWETT